MGLEDLLEAIEVRVREIKQADNAILQQHASRIAHEDAEDLRRAKSGLPVKPRLSALRAI
jgi:hypothetical protein